MKGIVITSAKPDFAGGMDLERARPDEGDAPAPTRRAGLFDGLMALHRLLRKIERAGMDPKTLKGGKPVAWAAPGLSAGIGTEIGLACHRRFMADTPEGPGRPARDPRRHLPRRRRHHPARADDRA